MRYIHVLFVSLFVSRFDLCQTASKDAMGENLGQLVFGERIQSSPYEVSRVWRYTR